MIKRITQFFDNKLGFDSKEDDKTSSHEEKLQLATAALLLEVARSDFDIAEEERQSIANSLKATFKLAESELNDLLELAELEVKEATSLHQFTRLIHENYTPADKKEIIRLLWTVAYADNVLDKYEEAIIRKVSDLLYVPHKDFMHAKSQAKS